MEVRLGRRRNAGVHHNAQRKVGALMARRAGKLLAVSGMDGAGKSRLIRSLAERFRRRGLVVRVREPGSLEEWDTILELASAGYAVLPRSAERISVALNVGRLRVLQELIRTYIVKTDILITARCPLDWAVIGAAFGSPLTHEVRLARAALALMPIKPTIVWLETSAQTALKRIALRGRRRDIREKTCRCVAMERLYPLVIEELPYAVVRLDAEQPARALAETAFRELQHRYQLGR